MNIGQVDIVAPAYMLCLDHISPSTLTSPSTITLKVEALHEDNVVEFPSLGDFCRKTFETTEVAEGTNVEVQFAIHRACNAIAVKSRRGAGNHFFVGPDSAFIPALTGLGYQYEALDWLAEDEILILYSGAQIMDCGFVWKSKDEGVEINAQPNVASYGQFLRIV